MPSPDFGPGYWRLRINAALLSENEMGFSLCTWEENPKTRFRLPMHSAFASEPRTAG